MIELPWPDKVLSPNASVHWGKKSAKIKSHRADAAWVTKHHVKTGGAISEHLVITFHPPDKRRRDLDNMLASAKAYLDGVSDALGIDDSEWSLTIQRGEVRKGGSVEIEFTTKGEKT